MQFWSSWIFGSVVRCGRRVLLIFSFDPSKPTALTTICLLITLGVSSRSRPEVQGR
jgi:hypothetical protein